MNIFYQVYQWIQRKRVAERKVTFADDISFKENAVMRERRIRGLPLY